MGELLTRVLSTSDRGLIGITKAGNEVPLDTPEPNLLFSMSGPGDRISLEEKNERQLRRLLKKPGIYIQLGESVLPYASRIQSYNLYRRRV